MSKKSFFFENIDSDSSGYYGEKILFDFIKDVFKDRECAAKHGYIMNFSGNRYTIESDVFLFDKELGINIFEVKGIYIDNIVSINMDGWHCRGFYSDRIDPNYQVQRNARNVLDFLKDVGLYGDYIGVKPAIVLPYITKSEWKSRNFDRYAFLPPVIFKDDLRDKYIFLKKLNDIPYKCRAKRLMNNDEYLDIKKLLFGQVEVESTICTIISEDELLKELLT